MSFSDIDRARAAWWAIGAALFVALLFIVYRFVGTFVFGIFIYYATRPIYRRLRRRISPPSLAAAVAIFALVLPALLLALYALAIVVQQATKFANNSVIDLAAYPEIQPLLKNANISLLTNPEALYQSGLREYLTAETAGSIFGTLTSTVGIFAIVGLALLHLFIMVAIAFYLLRDDKRLSRWVRTRFGDDAGVLEAYMSAVDRDLHSIFFGNILNALLTGTIGVIAYSLLNVFAPPGLSIPAPALVGLLAGAASLIPVVGMKLVYVPVALLMGGQAVFAAGTGTLWFVIAFVLVSFVVVDTIPDLVLRPYVSGRSLHVGAVMLAYTLGPLLFGWYGIFLTPMLLVFVVHFARIVLPELVAGKRIRPYVVDPSYLVDDTPSDSDAGTSRTSDRSASDGGRTTAYSDDCGTSDSITETISEGDDSAASSDAPDETDRTDRSTQSDDTSGR